MNRYDVVVVGAGMSGASVAYELAQCHRVLLLEREPRPGYHSTGRSAALFIATYGHEVPALRLLTRASHAFFDQPPDGVCTRAILSPRGMLTVCGADQVDELEASFAGLSPLFPRITLESATGVARCCPGLAAAFAAAGIFDPDVFDIDVNELHEGYLRGLRRSGGIVRTDCELLGLSCAGGEWHVTTRGGTFTAPIIVNAAGAWADPVAEMAGVRPLGIRPLRRTAVLVDPPPATDTATWPMIFDHEGRFYLKPDAGLLLASPVDETPSLPCDAQPEDFDVAVAVDWVERALATAVRRVRSRWAGLRCFAADRAPVIGFDDDVPGFFWLAGQGGHGIQIAPAAARLAAALIAGAPLPEELQSLDFDPATVAPERLRKAS